MNTTRWELLRRLQSLGLPVECGSGGLTKYNRTVRELPKTHWLDAACVGKSTPEALWITGVRSLLITANGHGCRQMCRMDKYGFPRTGPNEAKFVPSAQAPRKEGLFPPQSSSKGYPEAEFDATSW